MPVVGFDHVLPRVIVHARAGQKGPPKFKILPHLDASCSLICFCVDLVSKSNRGGGDCAHGVGLHRVVSQQARRHFLLRRNDFLSKEGRFALPFVLFRLKPEDSA